MSTNPPSAHAASSSRTVAHPALPLLSASRLRDARSCARFHFIRYELGYKLAHQAAAPRFGTLFHKGLEAWWRSSALPPGERLAATLSAVAGGAADAFEQVKAEEMLRGYHFRWIDEPLEVVAVEQQFDGPLRNPETGATSRTWRLGGKVDVLVRDSRDGLIRLVEHKTTSEQITPGSEYWQRLRMDGQISVYYEGARFLGHEVAGCVYDVAGKPMLQPRAVPIVDSDGVKIVHDATGERVRTKDGKKWRQTADAELGYALQTREETPDEYRARLVESIADDPGRFFQRGEVVRLENEMLEAMGDVWQLGQVIHENRRANRHPRNSDACKRYGRTCEYWPVCTGEAALDDTTRFKKLESMHPELEKDDAAASP